MGITAVFGFYDCQRWDYIYKSEKKVVRNVETKKILYVLGSRAKKNLYLFSERGRTTKKGYEYIMTDELRAGV